MAEKKVHRFRVTLTIANLALERDHPGYKVEGQRTYVTDAYSVDHACALAGRNINLTNDEYIRYAFAEVVDETYALTHETRVHSQPKKYSGDMDRD